MYTIEKEVMTKLGTRTAAAAPCAGHEDVPGIVIQDGCGDHAARRMGPRMRAFVYGEDSPVLPVLPFGRWKSAG